MAIAHSTKHGAASPSEDLDLYRLRDDLSRHFNPCGSYEVTLVGLIAQALSRLQAVYEDERKYRAEHDMVETITTNLKEFEAIARNIAQAERAWRKSIHMLEIEQRRRQKETLASPNARRAADRPKADPTPQTAELPPAPSPILKNPAPQKIRAARRE